MNWRNVSQFFEYVLEYITGYSICVIVYDVASTLSSEVFGEFTLLLLVFFQVTAAEKVIELSVHGGCIGPATADYLVRGMENAQNSDLVLPPGR